GVAGFRMAPSVQRFQSIVSTVGVAEPNVRRVLDEIARSERSSRPSTAPQRELDAPPKRIDFSSVGFRYDAALPEVVRDVDLSIRFGSAVAFVGASGAGKSTMIDLLLGLLEPTRGSIFVDGVPLPELSNWWRSRIAYVPQDVSLFDASV